MRSIDMPLCSHHLQFIHAAREDGREMQAVNNIVESQILAKLTYYKYRNFAKLHASGWFQPSVELAAKHWGLAKTASVIHFINQPARCSVDLAGLYPYNPIILVQHPCLHPITTTVQP
jgi:hypothetical protein